MIDATLPKQEPAPAGMDAGGRPEVVRRGKVLERFTIFYNSLEGLIVMPLLARAKRTVALALRGNALSADARQTDFCLYLSAILLAGLLLNALFGWWWADPVAGLGMAPIIAKEGLDSLRGKACACDAACH